MKKLKVGDVVVVIGYEHEGTRRIDELFDQRIIPGGVYLDRPVAKFRFWDEVVLMRVVMLAGDLVCDHLDPKQCTACQYLAAQGDSE